MGKIDDDVGPFPRSEQHPCDFYRGIQQTPIRADLPENRPVGNEHVEEPGVGRVEEAETVAYRLHVEVGPGFAVDDNRIAQELGNPERVDSRIRRRAVEPCIAAVGEIPLPGGIELTILNHHFDLPVAPRQADGVVDATGVALVTNQIKGLQSRIDVQPGEAQGLIVEPEGGGLLAVGVMVDGGAGGRRIGGSAGRGIGIVAAVGQPRLPAGREPLFRGAVKVRLDFGTVQVGDRRDRVRIGSPATGAVREEGTERRHGVRPADRLVDAQQALHAPPFRPARQFVDIGYVGGNAAPGLQRHPGVKNRSIAHFIGPDGGFAEPGGVAVRIGRRENLLGVFHHAHRDRLAAVDARHPLHSEDRQGFDEFGNLGGGEGCLGNQRACKRAGGRCDEGPQKNEDQRAYTAPFPVASVHGLPPRCCLRRILRRKVFAVSRPKGPIAP